MHSTMRASLRYTPTLLRRKRSWIITVPYIQFVVWTFMLDPTWEENMGSGRPRFVTNDTFHWGKPLRPLEMYFAIALLCLYDISVAAFDRKGQKPVPFFSHVLERYYFSCLIGWIMCRFTKTGDKVLDAYAGTAAAGVACVEKGRHYLGLLGIIKISTSCRCGEESWLSPRSSDHVTKYLLWCQVKCDLQLLAYYF